VAGTSRMRLLRPIANHVVNPLTRLVAGSLPGFAVLTTTGRRSGRQYRIPINVFEDAGSYVFALTYGADDQWRKNVVAAGGCAMRTRGRDVSLVDPEVFDDPGRRLVPAPVRLILRLVDVSEFVRMRPAEPVGARARARGDG
jgi:deazaflavin-dependent oxidoreductase (nitroreductase family)